MSDKLLTIDDARDASPGPNQGSVDAADDAGPDAAQGLVKTPEHLLTHYLFIIFFINNFVIVTVHSARTR